MTDKTDDIGKKLARMSLFRGLMKCHFDRADYTNLTVEQAVEKFCDGFIKEVLKARDLKRDQVNARLSEYMSHIKNSKTIDELYILSHSTKYIEILAR